VARGELRAHGLINTGPIHANLCAAALIEMALARGEGVLTDRGALVASTGTRTGRSPQDRFIVAEPGSRDQIDWGKVNLPMEPATFQRLLDKVRAYLQGRELFVVDAAACADPRHRLPVRVIAEKAWHALFAQCLFLRAPASGGRQPPAGCDGTMALPSGGSPLSLTQPPFTIINACGMLTDPASDGTRSEVFVALSLERRLTLIGGTHYAGEMKKSIFAVLNYFLPQQGVLPMHCSANIGPGGDTALFFGLSGTGKTTLSADPRRRLIGDDEHGWSDSGVFNLEGGCYAKTIRLSEQGEPQIWNAIRFGSVLENVVIDPRTRQADYDDARHTENTRAAYPVEFIDNCELSGQGGHPSNIIFLTCDAFGVLPPLARLTPEQAMYHFLSGYTAKVAGTETGVTEPQATFSTCFAAPFLPLPPARYAELLRERLQKHAAQVWLVNTGWTGGPYGKGSRIKLAYTRNLLNAVLSGELAHVPFAPDPVFGVLVPEHCPDVPTELLRPRNTWADPADYDTRARHLAGLFQANFQKYAAQTSEAVRQAGPT
jgi:phosphoenolpyruvate carboxykinase (ATP)